MGEQKYYPHSGPPISPCHWPIWPLSVRPEIHINLPGPLPRPYLSSTFPPPPFIQPNLLPFPPSFLHICPLFSTAPFGLFPFGPLVTFFCGNISPLILLLNTHQRHFILPSSIFPVLINHQQQPWSPSRIFYLLQRTPMEIEKGSGCCVKVIDIEHALLLLFT
jgi:hypothetical protein